MADSSSHQIPLPPSVQQIINKICCDQRQPPLEARARRLLASMEEEEALKILQTISTRGIRKTFDGFVFCLANQAHLSGANSSTVSPSKRLCLSSPTLPQLHDPSPASPATPTPTRISMDPSTSAFREGSYGRVVNGQLEALGELEFRKAFLILSYLGGKRLEEVITAQKIQEMKEMPMNVFELEVWESVGCKCDYIKEEDRIKYVDWDPTKTHIYHCHMYPDGSRRFKGPYLSNLRNFLQRALGDDNVLMVKFSEEASDKRSSDGDSSDYFSQYNKVVREGILVGLRRYRFFVFKDGGKEEKKKDPTTSPVKCFFVRMESDASIDNQDYILSGKTVREARSVFMHVENLPSLGNYMARLSLILSKTVNSNIDLSCVNVERIEDIACQYPDGNLVYDKDGKCRIHTDGTGFISKDLALKCPKNIYKGNCIRPGNLQRLLYGDQSKAEMKNSESHCWPLLIQFRLFNNGCAVKGTFLVNKKLPPQTMQVRPSMIKVETDPKLSNICTKNSFEIVGTSNKPKNANLSKNLIALLSYGGVTDEFFMGILDNALDDAQGSLSSKRSASRVALNHGDMDDFLVARMIFSGIPVEETYLQYRLSTFAKEEKKALRAGKIPVPESYYLMGTVDPTGILKSDEVCIILDNGHVSGKVLVYRNPGLHFGDIHVLKATYVKELEDFVGNAKYGIFFPCKGPRSLADEIATGDFDGDMYFVSRNPQLLEMFKPSEPWTSTSATHKLLSKKPCEFSDKELEDELFKLFLRTRFQPSYTAGLAADSWLAFMDRLLTLGAGCTNRDFMKASMCQLIDIYYDALDAPKKGGIKIEVPVCLRAELFPHYMEKNEEKSYTSTSILGKIYDKVRSYEELDLSTNRVWKLPLFDIEPSETCYMKWKKLYNEYRKDMTAALNGTAMSGEAADEVIKRYKEILYDAAEFELSKRERKDIFDEARAIYQIAYEHAESQGNVGNCTFPWTVAGSALCEIYMLENKEQPIRCSPSTLKEILS